MENKGFEQWMKAVDKVVERLAGLSVYDLPDMPFYDMYEDDYTPIEAARATLTESGW